MPSKQATASASLSTPPAKKKKGGLFACRSKHALDSLPRNARGDNAAIHRLQARNIFQHAPQTSESSASTAAVTPLTEDKGALKLAELNRTTNAPPALVTNPQAISSKPLYAQEVVDASDATELAASQSDAEHDEEKSEYEEARDILPDDRPLSPPLRPNTPGAIRSLSVSSKTGRIKRSLSLKRSGSNASAKLIVRAPPVSSADFANLPASSSSSSDLADHGEAETPLGDLASIRKARGRHQTAVLHQPVITDISEEEYLPRNKENVVPISAEVKVQQEGLAAETSFKRRAVADSVPESDSMRMVASSLEDPNDSVRFQPGPAVSTPKLEPPSPTKEAYIAEIRSQRGEGSEDTVSDLPTARGFWDPSPEGEECSGAGAGRSIPFQYVTNLSRPVSIASLRSLACPSTPPRTSSRLNSPNSNTYNGLRSTKSFSVSPLKKQSTFNGFPRTFFPRATMLKHSTSTASNQGRRKHVPEPLPALDFEHLHRQRKERRAQREKHHFPGKEEQQIQGKEEEENDEEDVDRQLVSTTYTALRTHTCSNCGVVEEQREFAAFVAKGKASRRTSVKQPLKSTASSLAMSGSLRKSKSMRQETIGEATLKRWGLAEAFQAGEKEGTIQKEKVATVKKAKKMVPGPGGGYITDTANMRWCSALDEIKKALAVDGEGEQEEEGEEQRVHDETQTALAQANDVLARLGVET